jgi:membrane protein insertase Oxa1/YidC/SpoIIIJ
MMAGLAAFMQFLQTKFFSPEMGRAVKGQKNSDFSDALKKQMTYFFPFVTFFVLLKIPSALSLYLIANAAFSIGQSAYVYRKDYVQQRRNKENQAGS